MEGKFLKDPVKFFPTSSNIKKKIIFRLKRTFVGGAEAARNKVKRK